MSDLVEFRHLKYIVALAEAGNFTRAAEQLFLSQPSLSKQIKDIEDEIGFPIFVRTREGVRTTPSGQMMVAYVECPAFQALACSAGPGAAWPMPSCPLSLRRGANLRSERVQVISHLELAKVRRAAFSRCVIEIVFD